MYLSGQGMILFSVSNAIFWVQRDGGFEVPRHGPKLIYRFTVMVEEETSDSSQKIPSTFSSNWVIPYQGACSQFLISPETFIRPFATGKVNFPFSWGNATSFAMNLLEQMRPSFPTHECMKMTHAMT